MSFLDKYLINRLKKKGINVGDMKIKISYLQSLLSLSVVGEVRIKKVEANIAVISDQSVIIPEAEAIFKIGIATRLIELEISNISLFLQWERKKKTVELYIESQFQWNDMISLLHEHLLYAPLKQSISQNRITIKAFMRDEQHKMPFVNATVEAKNLLIKDAFGNDFNMNFESLTPSISEFVNFDQLPEKLVTAIVCAEDISFWTHKGIEPYFIGYAINENRKSQKISRGGSTITMQLMRNLFLNHRRTFTRKIEESILALLTENYFRLSKQRIFELYINIIEFAPNTYGIFNASKLYFEKKPQELSLTEILVLTYIIPRPAHFYEALKLKTEQLKRNLLQHIISNVKYMKYRSLISEEDFISVDMEEIVFAPKFGILKLIEDREITEIIIHCTATKAGLKVTVDDVRQWHLQRGFDDIGYHYLIDYEGIVRKGRRESLIGAHCYGHNQNSIGICYTGGLASDGKTPADTRTEEQKKSMDELVNLLKSRYPKATVHGHNEFSDKDCPCFDVKQEYL